VGDTEKRVAIVVSAIETFVILKAGDYENEMINFGIPGLAR